MPAQTRRDLYLSVSADVTNLTAQMKAGRSALLTLGDAANDVQSEVQSAFAQLGANAPAQAKLIQQSYNATFSAIRQNMQAVLDAPTGSQAVGILGAAGAEQAAAAAERSAAALRIDADAAAIVAERQGDAGAAARVLAVALETQAQAAAQNAVAMREQADLLSEVAAEARVMGAAEEVAADSANELSGAHGRMARSDGDAAAAGHREVGAHPMRDAGDPQADRAAGSARGGGVGQGQR